MSVPTSPASVYHLAYVSTMTVSAGLRASTLADITTACKKNNTAIGLKGFIIFKQGKFLQYLEGDKFKVQSLYQAIQQDKRHKNIQLIVEGEGLNPRFFDQDIYWLEEDEQISGIEIMPLLDKFDTYHWKPEQVEQVVMEFAEYQQKNTYPLHAHPVRVESYLLTVIKQFLVRHSAFIVLQVMFMVLFCALAFYLL